MLRNLSKPAVLALIGFGLLLAALPARAQLPFADPENTLWLDLPTGRVVIQMRPDKAPRHVERIKELTRRGFYDGLIFHRVIEGFMAQTGDPTGTGTGASDLPDIEAEFNDLRHLRGTVAMARADDVNSANSQFYITFMPAANLDNKYTVWGRVMSGMQHVDAIARGEPPRNPTAIVRMQIAADARAEAGTAAGPDAGGEDRF